MSIDPVCHMHVDPETAITATHAGITYRFCSEPCRTRFAADPAAFSSSADVGREVRHPGRRSSTPMIVVALFVTAALLLWLAAPRSGIAGVLPYLLLLACPFLHLLFHRGHRHGH